MPSETPTRLDALLAFLHSGSAGGLFLMLGAVAALVWANSPAEPHYHHLLAFPLGLSAGTSQFVLSLEGWVNDAVMALFFLLVGLEIRHELTEGQLASPARAAAPAIAALGGMVVPAAIYLAFTWHDPAARNGWAVPVGTDIAFSLAVLRVLGRRVPAGLTVFLTALAIIDDIGAILIIAVFYSEHLHLAALGGAAMVVAALALIARFGPRSLMPFMIGFVALWVLLEHAGIHPTLSGVVLAFVVPASGKEGERLAARLEYQLAGWVAVLVLPLFGLANAGLQFDMMNAGMLTDPMVLGIVLGLCIGKPVGVLGATWAGARLGILRLPAQLTWPLLSGAALLCGIGFTMSLFIGHLAFAAPERMEAVKGGVFAASLLSAFAGLAVLARARHAPKAGIAPAVQPGT